MNKYGVPESLLRMVMLIFQELFMLLQFYKPRNPYSRFVFYLLINPKNWAQWSTGLIVSKFREERIITIELLLEMKCIRLYKKI